MKKSIKRTLSFVVACLSLFLLFAAPVGAAELDPIMPCGNNVTSANTTASVSSTGLLKMTNRYTAPKDKFKKAVITTYIEKRTLGLFWKRVDINRADNQWVDTLYTAEYSHSRTFQLASNGTYRVTAKFVFSGSGGSDDVITKTATVEY